MKSDSLCKVAFWLLQHQVGGYRAESLVGDLTEEYTLGRSARWLWSQVIIAIARSYLRALRLFGPRFLGAIAIGWSVLYLGVELVERTSAMLEHRPGASGANAVDALVVPLLELFIDVAAGRLVVRFYRPHRKLAVGAFAFSIFAAWDLPWLCSIAADTSRLAEGLLFTFLWTAGVWIGGLWQIRVEAKGGKTS